MHKQKAQLFQRPFYSTYFALGLDCSYPVLQAITMHWPCEFGADEKAGLCLQIELWHAIRYHLVFKALAAGWTVSRSDQFIELTGSDEVTKCINKELGLLLRPREDPKVFEVRLPGTLPWIPNTKIGVARLTFGIGEWCLTRLPRPQRFTVYSCWRECDSSNPQVNSYVENQQLRLTLYENQLKNSLDNFWSLCLATVPTTDDLPRFNTWYLDQWAFLRGQKAYEEIELHTGEYAEPLTKICSNCRTSWPQLRRCSFCKVTKYCDVLCQNTHWPSHKEQCRILRNRRRVEPVL